MASKAIEMQCGRVELVSPHPKLTDITASSLTFKGEDLLTYDSIGHQATNALNTVAKVFNTTATVSGNIYVVGINQLTGQSYTEAWDGSTTSTSFGTDWAEGYYRIHVKFLGVFNGESVEVNLEKLPIYWNKSYIAWLLWMPAGSFWMGSPEDEPGHQSNELLKRVTLTTGFYIARTLCTQAMFDYIMNGTTSGTSLTARNQVAFSYYDYLGRRYVSNAWHYKDDSGVTVPDATAASMFLYKSYGRNAPTSSYPEGQIVDTTHDGAFDKMNANHAISRDGTAYTWRPPYEAEWEYACRAGVNTSLTDGKILRETGEAFYTDLDKVAWYKGNSSGAKVVALKYPNLVGLYDMLGNLYEWNYDYLYNFTNGSPKTNPWGSTQHSSRSLRGGSFYVAASGERCARRHNGGVSISSYYLGFRLALALI